MSLRRPKLSTTKGSSVPEEEGGGGEGGGVGGRGGGGGGGGGCTCQCVVARACREFLKYKNACQQFRAMRVTCLRARQAVSCFRSCNKPTDCIALHCIAQYCLLLCGPLHRGNLVHCVKLFGAQRWSVGMAQSVAKRQGFL